MSPDRCTWGEHGPIPCSVHGPVAKDASDAAARNTLRTSQREGRDAARMAQGAGYGAWQRALERPLTPCADGSPGLGWPDPDDGAES